MDDFDVNGYRRFNPDLANQDDEWLRWHYFTYGQGESRIYQVDLPLDFQVQVYRALNPDIQYLSDDWLRSHYFLYGLQEERRYKDPLFAGDNYEMYLQDIRQTKSTRATSLYASVQPLPSAVVLINHSQEQYGATQYLHRLRDFLQASGDQVVVLEPRVDDNVFSYDENVISYHADEHVLYWLCVRLSARVYYFNSMNREMALAIPYVKLTGARVILHSHEIKQHYHWSGLIPDFVVSERIAQQYQTPPQVQPPVLWPMGYQEQVNSLVNELRELDRSKIVLGMCGSLTARKNYQLFYQVADFFQAQFEFVWIGGSSWPMPPLANVFHVPETRTPGSYYGLLDYFVLFSLHDPCPYVVLENLEYGNRVLTFRDSIYTNHNHPLLCDLYFEYPGVVSFASCVAHISAVCHQKAPTTRPTQGKTYVQANFGLFQPYFRQIFYPDHRVLTPIHRFWSCIKFLGPKKK